MIEIVELTNKELPANPIEFEYKEVTDPDETKSLLDLTDFYDNNDSW